MEVETPLLTYVRTEKLEAFCCQYKNSLEQNTICGHYLHTFADVLHHFDEEHAIKFVPGLDYW